MKQREIFTLSRSTKLEIIIYMQKTSKVKKYPNKMIGTKQSLKIPLSSFYVGHLLVGMVSVLKCGLDAIDFKLLVGNRERNYSYNFVCVCVFSICS